MIQGSNKNTGTAALETKTLGQVEEAFGTRAQTTAHITASQSSVRHTLHREHLHPYHLNSVIEA